MTHFYDWKPEFTLPFLAIISVSIGFVIGWFLAYSEKIKNKIFTRFSGDKAWISFVVFQKLMGVLFMGFIPGLIIVNYTSYSISQLGINFEHFSESLLYTGIIGILILISNYFAARNPKNLEMYPQMRINSWSIKVIIINTTAWIAYLTSYELMYRGILLVICNDVFGFWPAVAINLMFYSATHIAKGLTETIGAFPYGLILCFVTISTGSIFVAVATHLILALSNDYFSVYHNPAMKFIRQ